MTYDWRDDAACRGIGHEVFYPEKGDNIGAYAKKICKTCPVRADCLESALTVPERFGVWGGMTERERRQLRKAREAAALADVVDEVAIERVIAKRGPGTGLSRAERLELARRLVARGKGTSELARLLGLSGKDARRLMDAALPKGEAA